jgi:hypothetical protein
MSESCVANYRVGMGEVKARSGMRKVEDGWTLLGRVGLNIGSRKAIYHLSDPVPNRGALPTYPRPCTTCAPGFLHSVSCGPALLIYFHSSFSSAGTVHRLQLLPINVSYPNISIPLPLSFARGPGSYPRSTLSLRHRKLPRSSPPPNLRLRDSAAARSLALSSFARRLRTSRDFWLSLCL